MKKFLCGFTLIVITFVSFGQEAYFGLKLGNNFSSFSGDDSKGFSSKTGLFTGIFYKYKSAGFFGIETGMSYSKLGADANIDSNNITVGYLDYPFILRYDVYYGIHIQAGIEFSLKIHSKVGGVSDYFEDDIKFGDTRYLVGVGYEIAESRFAFDLIYKAGFSTIMSEPEEDYDFNGNTITYPQLDIKNSVVLISVGYFFD